MIKDNHGFMCRRGKTIETVGDFDINIVYLDGVYLNGEPSKVTQKFCYLWDTTAA